MGGYWFSDQAQLLGIIAELLPIVPSISITSAPRVVMVTLLGFFTVDCFHPEI